MKKLFFSLLAASVLQLAQAQNKTARIDFETYDPPSSLKVKEHLLTKAKFPFIDVHNHQPNMPTQDLNALLKEMDALNMKIMVNLSGRGFKNNNGRFDVSDHQYLASAVQNAKKASPNRLIVFTNVSFEGAGSAGWAEAAVKGLEADVKPERKV